LGGGVSLHDEIEAFLKYTTATTDEITLRNDLVARFMEVVGKVERGATARPFGSFVTGLFLPTSDVDVVITPVGGYCHGIWEKKMLLTRLDRHVRTTGFAANTRLVLNASVPVLRITDELTGLEIDVTVDEDGGHGICSTEAVVGWMKRLDDRAGKGMMAALVAVVKQFLAMRKLGNTYTGGVNSYLLVWMVVSFLEQEFPKHPTFSLDTLLLSFLKFYGTTFNYKTTKISLTTSSASYTTKPQSPQYFPTHSLNPNRNYLLCITDPAENSIDVGIKAYAIKHVQATLKDAYEKLDLALRRRDKNVLGVILAGDYSGFMAARERALEGRYR
jgi:non-canonical poly(A) RNA polymerase PAPD5/7